MNSAYQDGPGKIFISQINVPAGFANTGNNTDKLISIISTDLESRGFNLSLPIVKVSSEEERFDLVSGIPIFHAAKKAGLSEIWVIAISPDDALEQVVSQLSIQSNANERLILDDAVEEFIKFLNNSETLTTIKGIGKKYEEKIISNRPYSSEEDFKKKLGQKQPIKWLKAFIDSV